MQRQCNHACGTWWVFTGHHTRLLFAFRSVGWTGGGWGHTIAGIVRVVCWLVGADSKEMNG